MGVMDVLYSFGFKYENPDKPYDLEGYVNSAEAVKGLEFYKELYDCCTPPGTRMPTCPRTSTRTGPAGRAAHELRLHLAGHQCRRQCRGEKSVTSPTRQGRMAAAYAQLGGQGISVVSSSQKQEDALAYIKWFRAGLKSSRNGGRWALLRRSGKSSRIRVLRPASPMRRPSSIPWPSCRTSGRSRATPRCCRRRRNASMTMSSPVRAPLRTRSTVLVKDWTQVFDDEGKYDVIGRPAASSGPGRGRSRGSAPAPRRPRATGEYQC